MMESFSKLKELERDRIYCCHGIEHSLDVARISYIMSLEQGYSIQKDMIYATALLHDLGRIYEYKNECSHVSGSLVLALRILPDCGFSKEEVIRITSVIAAHRKKESKEPLEKIFYEADTLSRPCFSCKAKKTCKWNDKRMNLYIAY